LEKHQEAAALQKDSALFLFCRFEGDKKGKTLCTAGRYRLQ
jgi:hypothetical protein